MNIATWNMQGSGATNENKWNSGVQPLLNAMGAGGILCLQECGGVPGSAELIDTLNFTLSNGLGDVVKIYEWGSTQHRDGYNIFFHCWDTGGNRVNTAIVTDVLPPDMDAEVALLSPQGFKLWRPSIGLKINDSWTFSFHAISPGGPDGKGMLKAVAANFKKWTVCADWNRKPNDLQAPFKSVICKPNADTYPVKQPASKYDYCVRSGNKSVTGTVETSIIMSDHFPVRYAFEDME